MADSKVLHSLSELQTLLERWGLSTDDWILTGQYVYGLLGHEVSVRKGHHNVLVRKDKIPWKFAKDALEVYPPVGSEEEEQFRKYMRQTGFEFDLIPLDHKKFTSEKNAALSYKLPGGKEISMQDEAGQLRILENILSHSDDAGWGLEKGRRILALVSELNQAFEKDGKTDLAELHKEILQRFSFLREESAKNQAGEKLAELLKTQKSLTEWLDDIKHKDAEAIRREDNDKRERLKILNAIIGLPFDEPVQFEAVDLKDESDHFKKYLKEHGDELCAIRLIPKEDGLEKLRMRGKTVADAFEWFLDQNIDPNKYRVDFIPHAAAVTSLIFIINDKGIQGEIIRGPHTQLTQGFHDKNRPIIFKYDFKNWHISENDADLLDYLKKLITYLRVGAVQQKQLRQKIPVSFTHDYLEGYFESYESSEFGTWFIDYSPMLGKMYADMDIPIGHGAAGLVKGLAGSPGKAKGPVKIVEADKIDADDFPDGGVLVCAVTTPNYVPLMQKAAAIVTDQGGILSHAAIVARELGKPCIVGTGNATKILKNGQVVTVDAAAGSVIL